MFVILAVAAIASSSPCERLPSLVQSSEVLAAVERLDECRVLEDLAEQYLGELEGLVELLPGFVEVDRNGTFNVLLLSSLIHRFVRRSNTDLDSDDQFAAVTSKQPT